MLPNAARGWFVQAVDSKTTLLSFVVRRIFNQRVNVETMAEQLAAGKTFDQLMGEWHGEPSSRADVYRRLHACTLLTMQSLRFPT